MKLQMLIDIKKLLKHQMSRKSVQWEPSCPLGWTDRQTYPLTEMMKLMEGFRNFAKTS